VNDSSNDFRTGRHAGLLLPLFSAAGDKSWGIGEIGDLPALASWLSEAGLDFVQVLPINEMPEGQHSPYSAISAMAIDPIFISVWELEDFHATGGEQALPDAARRTLAEVRGAPRIDYDAVRTVKMAALRSAFAHFREHEWQSDSSRGRALRRYLEDEAWWLQDYTLYRSLRSERQATAWWTWDGGLAAREPEALAAARERLAGPALFHAYLQWLADEQWHRARRAAAPVGVFGDLPFMVGSDSADVWASQHAFQLDATVGAPPDAFSETGQDWGLPVYRWDVFAGEGDAWIHARARRNAALFDGYRIDHLVGFYRTYVIPADGSDRVFSPPEELEQLAQGERVMRAFLASGARIIAEDLGTVPTFVRESLLRLGIPGYKVLRWEREWEEPGQPFRDPLAYPEPSVATTGTHDTETLVEWWESAPREEKVFVAQIPWLRNRSLDLEDGICGRDTQDAILELLVASSSELLILPVQDLFGWRDRINVPATVTDDNWTWRLPWPVSSMRKQPEANARAKTLRGWMHAYGRARALFRRLGDAAAAKGQRRRGRSTR
jgi:4-alpha-glucanotransferase